MKRNDVRSRCIPGIMGSVQNHMKNRYGGHNMVETLKDVLVCAPAAAGWHSGVQAGRWQELGFLHEPRFADAEQQHALLRQALEAAGCEVRMLEPSDGLTIDATYTHDASFLTDLGALCLRMGKPSRALEPQTHRTFYETHGVPILGVMEPPAAAEAGDLLWLNSKTLLVGRGFRTNDAGIEWLKRRLNPHGVTILSVPLPHGRGPDACLHLMSLMSMLDSTTALVDLPLLTVETVELLHSKNVRLVEIEESERATLAANVLSLGESRLLAFEENPKTNARLRSLGYHVATFPGGEIGINGGGGPTCLTRPILRSPVISGRQNTRP